MNKKELADKIYEAEMVIQNSSNKEEIRTAKKTIQSLSSKINNLEDLMFIDDYIQKKLKK